MWSRPTGADLRTAGRWWNSRPACAGSTRAGRSLACAAQDADAHLSTFSAHAHLHLPSLEHVVLQVLQELRHDAGIAHGIDQPEYLAGPPLLGAQLQRVREVRQSLVDLT